MMQYALYAIITILFITSTVALLRLGLERREIRRFSRELQKHKDTSYAQPIKVDTFSREITDLANKLNNLSGLLQTERIEYERQRESLGNVISGISHDFRTPLTSALGYMQLMEKSGELSEQNTEYLHIAIQKNKYLKELSDEFFELTKAENGLQELQTESINLSNILSEMLLEQLSWIEERGIKTRFDIQDDCIILCDMTCLTRILQNLMSNAQKYTSDFFGAELHKDKGSTVLRIFNTLCDCENVDIEKVFEPFYKIKSRTKEGSGLGLYVTKTLCRKQGWDISAHLSDNTFMIEIIIPESGIG